MPIPHLAKVSYYRGVDGWRWRVQASNGRILSASSEAYQRFIDCERSLVLTRDALLYRPAVGGPPMKPPKVATAAARRR